MKLLLMIILIIFGIALIDDARTYLKYRKAIHKFWAKNKAVSAPSKMVRHMPDG